MENEVSAPVANTESGGESSQSTMSTEVSVQTESTASDTSQQSQETVSNQQEQNTEPTDLWAKLDALNEEAQDSADKGVEESGEKPDDFQDAEKAEDVKADSDDTATEAQEDDGFEDDERTLSEKLKDPKFGKSEIRRLNKLEKRDKTLLEPFRDHNVPIQEAWTALANYMPTRAEELQSQILDASLKAYPNEVMSALLDKEGVTVDSVKAALEGKAESASKDADRLSEVPAFAEQPEVKLLIDELDNTYGDDWRDPSKDGNLIDEDKLAVQSLRSMLATEAKQAKLNSQLQSQLEQARSQIEQLTPEVEGIKTEQQTQFEQDKKSAFTTFAQTYQNEIKEASVPSVLEEQGLTINDNDTESVKAVKSLVNSRFESQNGYDSDFQFFMENGYSQSDTVRTITDRVIRNIADASDAEVRAKRTNNAEEAKKLTARAEQLKSLVKDEQSTLTVLASQAASEYLSKEFSPILKVLEENANLKKQTKQTRPETVQGDAGTTDGRAARLAEIVKSEDPLGMAFGVR